MNTEIEEALAAERARIKEIIHRSESLEDFEKLYILCCETEQKILELAKQLHVIFQAAKRGTWTWDAIPEDYRQAIIQQATRLIQANPNLKIPE